MFLHLSVSHSVHRGVSVSVHAGIYHPPPGQTPPWADTPLPSACWDTPPPSACWDTLLRTVRITLECILVSVMI